MVAWQGLLVQNESMAVRNPAVRRTPSGRPDLSASDLTSREAVLAAIAEADRLGREAFLAAHGFRRALAYELEYRGRRYDSKAIVGVALGYQHGRPNELKSGWFTGGAQTVVPALEALGFRVVNTSRQRPRRQPLTVAETYSWAELGFRFGFEPGWLNRVGGMASLPEHGAVLVITHPGGGRSFNYEDYWEGRELIYTGKGQKGDQQLTSENRLVADNSRDILVFEHAGPAALTYLGVADCVDFWPAVAPDRRGTSRRVYRFRLRFRSGLGAQGQFSGRGARRAAPPAPAATHRRPRPFDPSRVPARFRARRGSYRTRDEILAEQEKATHGHHALMTDLHAAVTAAGWTDIAEIHSAVDLWASCPQTGGRVIFEAKTIRAGSEGRRLRTALAQLLEYRFLYGAPADELCVVTSAPVSDERLRFLRSLGIDTLWFSAGRLNTNDEPCCTSIAALTSR